MEDGGNCPSGQGSGPSWLPSMHQLLPLLLLLLWVFVVFYVSFVDDELGSRLPFLRPELQHEPSIQGSGVQHDTNKNAAELWTLLYDELRSEAGQGTTGHKRKSICSSPRFKGH